MQRLNEHTQYHLAMAGGVDVVCGLMLMGGLRQWKAGMLRLAEGGQL